MTPVQVLWRLGQLGVNAQVEGKKIRLRPASAIPAELRSVIQTAHPGLVRLLGVPECGLLDDAAGCRARASWLGRLGGAAGYDAQALFDLIDATMGRRVLGPYELNQDEAAQIAVLLRAQVGQRAPVEPVASAGPATPHDAMPGEVSALHLKRELDWTDRRFVTFCRRLIGRPGPSTADEDRRVHAAMRREG